VLRNTRPVEAIAHGRKSAQAVVIIAWTVLSRLAAADYFLHCVLVLRIVGLFGGTGDVPVSLRQNVLAAASPDASGGNR